MKHLEVHFRISNDKKTAQYTPRDVFRKCDRLWGTSADGCYRREHNVVMAEDRREEEEGKKDREEAAERRRKELEELENR